MQIKKSYLLEIQYLGFRYSGWALQPNGKTVSLMLQKTLRYVLGEDKPFRFLASGRTDAMVSVESTFVELFLESELEDVGFFAEEINRNLPMDIRLLGIQEVGEGFNVMQSVVAKEYRYFFAVGEKSHPFAAHLLTTFQGYHDLEQMKRGARVFEGTHDFRDFCENPSPQTKTLRTIEVCEIVPNTELTASFFPEQTWMFRVRGKGFMRKQVRMMVGALVLVGRGELSVEEIVLQLNQYNTDSSVDNKDFPRYVAPASGLMLHKVEY